MKSTSTTLCDSQVCSRSCFGAHRIFAGAHVVAADTPTTTESPATTVPTQPSEGEATLSLNEEASQLTVEKPTAPAPIVDQSQPTLPDRELRVSDLDRLIREEASSVAESDVAAQPATAATETPAKDPDQEEKLAKKRLFRLMPVASTSHRIKSRKSLMKQVRRVIQTCIF